MSQSIPLDANAIAAISPHLNPRHLENVIIPQIVHRIELVKIWEIQEGENVLEIGCGQGDCTVALAAAVGEKGHVTGVDPAPLDYGAPFTLAQAQAHLKSSPLGERITFVQVDPVAFLRDTTKEFSTAILAHCIWYFASPSVLTDILSALSTRVQRVCLAEYNLTATDPRSVPHIIAALTQASMEAHKPDSEGNIRTVLSPAAIQASATNVGLVVAKKQVFTPNEGMLDATWEMDTVAAEAYVGEINTHVKDERERAVVIAMRDSLLGSKEILNGQKVRTMDVCAFVFNTQKA